MWVVESTVVLNARDNTKSALSSVQKSIEQIAHESVKLQKSFEEFDLTGLEWFTKEVFQTQNNIWNLTNLLSHFTQWSEEYNNVQKMIADEQERLNKLFEESADRQTEIADQRLQEIQAEQEEVQVKSSLIDKLKEIWTSIAENTQKLFWNREQTMSNSEAVKYREWRIKALKKSIEEQNVVLANSKVKYWENSVEVKRVEENLAELNQELKENKQRLKEATINVSPFQMALQKLGRNIKSLFFLQAGKAILDTTRKLIQAGINEFIEWWLKMEAVAEQFDYLAQRGWMSAITLRNSLREASRGMVADTDLMKSANKAMMLWVGQNTEMMTNLMKIAQVRAAAMDETTTKAFDDIVLWIWRLSPKILDNLWIIVNLNDAYADYADKVWKWVKELSKAEQQMAVYEAVLQKSRTELQARGRDNLSVADKIQILKVKAVNSIDVIWGSFMRRIEPLIEWLWDILDKWTQVADDLSAEMDSATNNIRVGISTLLWNIFDDNVEICWEIWNTVKDTVSNILNNLLELWNWFLSFFGDTEDNAQITSQNVWDYLLLMINAVWDWVVWLTKAFANLRDWVSWWLWTAKNTFQKVKAWLSNVYNTKDSELSKWWFFDTISKKFKEWYNSVKDTTRDIEQVLSDHQWVWTNFTLDVMKKEEKLANSLVEWWRYKASKAGDRLDALFGWDDPDDKTKWWSSGSKKSKNDDWLEQQKKAMSEYWKETERRHKNNAALFKELDKIATAFLKETEKNIKDLEKEFENATDEVQKKIDDTVKNIEKLEQDIAKLKEDLAELTQDRDKSLAEEFLSAQDTAKELEKEFEWIGDIAKNTSRDEINNAFKWDFIWWYAVENIKKMKTALEETAWIYDWMSDDEIEALKEQIKYQEWYNSLNKIEQIKEDYRVKREEIEKELQAKEQALKDEQALKIQFEQELEDIRAKYTPIIEQQKQLYNDIQQQQVAFETEYSSWLDTNYTKELSYAQQLEIWWKKVADARKSAEVVSADVKWKAVWWPVSVNTPYIVWEKWPELFIPNSSGRIVPNNEITNNNGISINLSWITVRSDADINAITDEIIRKIKLEKSFWIA